LHTEEHGMHRYCT